VKVSFIGLGRMGLAIARNLLSAGFEMTVYNRTRSRADELQDDGARVAATPSEAARSAEVLITMLSDDIAVEQVVFGEGGVLGSLGRDAVHISMSTISVALSRRLAREHKAAGQQYIAAPVFGRPDAAQAAKLFVIAAGPDEALKYCDQIFSAIGQKTFVVGENASSANVVKLSGNFLIASVIESLGEAFALVRKHGIDPEQYLDILTNTLFSAPAYKNYGGLIAHSRYRPAGFELTLGLKDVRLALGAAEAAAVPMPIASVIRDRFITAFARGLGDADWSALGLIAAQDSGLES